MAPGDFECLLGQGIPSVSAVDLQEILVDVLQRSWSHRVTAQSRREDAVQEGGRSLCWCSAVVGDFRGDLSVFQLGGIVDSVGEFCRGIRGPFPAFFLSLYAVLGRDSVFFEEGFSGGFSEVVHLLHGFWVLSGAVSTGILPIFSSFR